MKEKVIQKTTEHEIIITERGNSYECDDWVSFDNGRLDAGTYSYEIGSSGYIELSEEETYQLYLVMKSYYESEVKR